MISTENWNTVMYNTMMFNSNPLWGLVPISVVMFGNYIIMNLFISILLQVCIRMYVCKYVCIRCNAWQLYHHEP